MSGDTMTADVAREALSTLEATGACGAPTLRSALTTVIALDVADGAPSNDNDGRSVLEVVQRRTG